MTTLTLERGAAAAARGVTGSVLLVGNLSPFSNRVCVELAEQLSGAGWSVLTTSAEPRPLRRALDMVRTTWRGRRAYTVAQVDVYSHRAFLWAEAVCWTLRRARKPYILTLHGGDLPRFSRGRAGRVRRLLRSAAVVTTPSRYLAEQMRPYREDLLLLPNAVDIRAYPFQRRSRPMPHLLWLRAFQAVYNPALAPEVVARLAGEFADVQLIMVGPDKDGTQDLTRQTARALGVAERIAFPGWVRKADVPDWLYWGDIFLNTTHQDNTPGSVLEAMACGLCVVSTNVGGIPYLLEHERDALLVPPDDPDAMAAAVRRIMTEPDLAQTLSGNARAKVEGFDFSVVLPQWEALLRRVAEGHGR